MSFSRRPFFALWGSSEPAPAEPQFEQSSPMMASSDGLWSGSPELVQAKLSMLMFTELFNKTSQVCWRKCFSAPGNSEHLEPGEATCIDRCVAKFVMALNACDEALSEHNRKFAEQQAQMAAAQQQFGQ